VATATFGRAVRSSDRDRKVNFFLFDPAENLVDFHVTDLARDLEACTNAVPSNSWFTNKAPEFTSAPTKNGWRCYQEI
jgi:hypothetical protein